MGQKTIDKRVSKGVAWLNRNRKGWLDKIDLNRLNLRDPNTCIIGEVDGDYFETFGNTGKKNRKAEQFGFTLPGAKNKKSSWIELTQVWVKKIIELRFRLGKY